MMRSPVELHVSLFRDFECVIDFHAKIANGAVDREIEKRQIPRSSSQLESDADRPDLPEF